MNSRQRRCRPTTQARSRILAAAIGEFSERSLHGARMGRIAAARVNPYDAPRETSLVDRASGEGAAGSVLAAMSFSAGAVPRRRRA